jgi:hypothetical protein
VAEVYAEDVSNVLSDIISRDKFSEASGGEVGGASGSGKGMGGKGSHKVTMNWVEVDKGGGWGGHGMGEGDGRRDGSKARQWGD